MRVGGWEKWVKGVKGSKEKKTNKTGLFEPRGKKLTIIIGNSVTASKHPRNNPFLYPFGSLLRALAKVVYLL